MSDGRIFLYKTGVLVFLTLAFFFITFLILTPMSFCMGYGIEESIWFSMMSALCWLGFLWVRGDGYGGYDL